MDKTSEHEIVADDKPKRTRKASAPLTTESLTRSTLEAIGHSALIDALASSMSPNDAMLLATKIVAGAAMRVTVE